MFEVTSHTVIAFATLVGSFALLVISQVTGRPLSDGTSTLITMLLGTVTGYYFGSRGAISGMQAAGTLTDPHRTDAAPTPAADEHSAP